MSGLEKLAALLRSPSQIPARPASEAPIGSGMASQAAAVLKSLPYQKHVQEAKAMGQQPMTPEEFAQVSGAMR